MVIDESITALHPATDQNLNGISWSYRSNIDLNRNFCEHNFHCECLENLLPHSINSKCPLCRCEITAEDRVALIEAG